MGITQASVSREETTGQPAAGRPWLVIIQGVVLKESVSFPSLGFQKKGSGGTVTSNCHLEGMWKREWVLRSWPPLRRMANRTVHLPLNSRTFLLSCRKEDKSFVLNLPPRLPTVLKREMGLSQLCPHWKNESWQQEGPLH